MKKELLKILSISALCIMVGFTASAQQGRTHDHPISDELVEQYLQEYCGIYNYSGSNWSYLTTSNSSDPNTGFLAPTATLPGDVIVVEVNDFWANTNSWNSLPTDYDQVKYGVKAIHKVTNNASIGSGTLYQIDLTTNRFFFAIRANSCRPLTFRVNTSSVSYNGTNYYTLSSDQGPFGWYNEFSACENQDVRWEGLEPSYEELQGGTWKKVPHSCRNSLINCHFTTLYDKETTSETYAVSAFLYIPQGINLNENIKTSEYSLLPYVFFYMNKLEGTLKKSSTQYYYNAKLDWKTGFDNAKDQSITFTDWSSTTGGVKEVSKIYRRIEGGGYELIAQDIEELKTWTDTDLRQGSEGYNVDYYVVTEVYKYDKDGNRGDYVTTASTNEVSFYVPAIDEDYAFNLKIEGGHGCTFNPNANKIHQSNNAVVNTIMPLANEETPIATYYQVGDKFVLTRIEGNTTTAIQTATVTKALANGTYTEPALLTETFDKSTKAGTSNIASSINDYTDNSGWNGTYLYQEASGIRIGNGTGSSGSHTGTLVTPELDLSNCGGTVTIKINAKGNGSSTTRRTLTVSCGGRSGTATLGTTAGDATITLTNVSGVGQTITFSSPSRGPVVIYNIEIIPGDGSAKQGYNFAYSIDGGAAKTWSGKAEPTPQEFLDAVATTTDRINSVPGDRHDAQYKLTYIPVTTTRKALESNTVECRGLKSEVAVANAFRSGTPDAINNPAEERYNFDVKFTPIYGTDVASYYIWRNAEERVARIDQVSGGRFKRIYKDGEGHWSIEGEEITADEQGYVTVGIAYDSETHVREGEFSDSQQSAFEDLFYTVEVEKVDKSTYGNYDRVGAFSGTDAELVVSAEGQYMKAVSVSSQGREYRADITWTPNSQFIDKIAVEGYQLQYYTVHRRLLTNNEQAYSPMTNRFSGEHNSSNQPVITEVDADGIKYYPGGELHFIDLFLADPNADVTFNGFPANYYVKAHFAPVDNAPMYAAGWLMASDIARNIIEKNSNALPVNDKVITAITDIDNGGKTVASVSYYNLLGMKVAKPEPGQVTIVKKQYTDGTMTTAKVKF